MEPATAKALPVPFVVGAPRGSLVETAGLVVVEMLPTVVVVTACVIVVVAAGLVVVVPAGLVVVAAGRVVVVVGGLDVVLVVFGRGQPKSRVAWYMVPRWFSVTTAVCSMGIWKV